MVSMTVITLMTRGCIALASGSPHVDVALHLSIEPAPPHFPIFIVVMTNSMTVDQRQNELRISKSNKQQTNTSPARDRIPRLIGKHVTIYDLRIS